ncbi:MAG: N-acetyltransferase [Corynebacteriales bacterium]|nr:N-acetyltransferase [Mycobacteriales bacterium]
MVTQWVTRPETPADIPAIRQVNLSAFPTALEADLVDALRTDPAWIPEFSIVAQDEGVVTGYALLTRCHVDDAPALALAPCAVLTQSQGRGAGGAAIRAALAAAQSAGENLVLVLGHPEYYPRFGFRPASTFSIRAPFDVPDAAMMALAFDNDKPVPSGTIRYAAPFNV